ncbi:MAG: glycosyltransferase [Candidatus Hydrogenedentes bacterium]|nr:glycosyltransferase [Candidatus Hydrogenedentota bacterium]
MTEFPFQLVLGTVLALPTAYLMVVSAYLLVICIGAWLYRPEADYDASPMRVALLVPAHNEAAHLPALIASAQQLRYPRDRFDLFIIADNCTDKTAEIARQEGAHVFERHDLDHRGKGPALDWALKTQAEIFSQYDAISLVDADMHIDPEFLRELAASLAVPGVEVVQALNTVAHPENNWRTALGFAGFAVVNHVRPAGRCWLGGTGELKGSGMAFRAPLLLRYGWPSHALAEDVEFAKMLFLDGIRVQYNPRALVTSEIPTQRSQIKVQQQRWERGKLDLFRRYAPRLSWHFLRHPSVANLDALLDILVPPQSVLALTYLSAAALSLLVHPLWTALLVACLTADALCIASGLLLTRAPLRIWLYLGAVPLLLLWKLRFYLRLLFTRHEGGWQRTPRDGEVAGAGKETQGTAETAGTDE